MIGIGVISDTVVIASDTARFQTSSATYVDLTGISVSLTAATTHQALISYSVNAYNGTAAKQNIGIVDIGGTGEAISEIIAGGTGDGGSTYNLNAATFLKTGLSGATTIKVQVKTTGGTFDTGGGVPYFIQATEILK